MKNDLSVTAAKLLADVERVLIARATADEIIGRTKKDYPGTGLQFRVSIEFALWAEVKFQGNWNKFESFLRESIEGYNNQGGEPTDKSQLWVVYPPYVEDPEIEVTRTFDRIDFALHYITKEVGMELPFKSILDGGWQEKKHVERVFAFAMGLTDVLDPDGRSQLALQY